MKTKIQKGFSLMEIMITILVFVIGLGSLLIIIFSVKYSFALATDKFVAQNLAMEGVENIRNHRDNNLLNPAAGWRDGIIGISSRSIPKNGVDFTRVITIRYPELVNCLKVESRVTWGGGVDAKEVIMSTRLCKYGKGMR